MSNSTFTNDQSLECQLFVWESWGFLENEIDCQFFNCELKVDIGLYKQGTRVYCVVVEYQTSTIEIYEKDTTLPNLRANLKIFVSVPNITVN